MKKRLIIVLSALIMLSLIAANAFADGSPETLKSNLENADFYVQDGILYEFDTLKLASEGKLLTCFGNNAGSAYLILNLPPAPEQDSAPGNPESESQHGQGIPGQHQRVY